MERKNSRSLTLLRILSILLCLTLISTWMLANMYARYTTQASGEDSARVAAFSITDNSVLTRDYTVTLVPGETENLDVAITNKSEVALRYVFDFAVDGNLPLEVAMKNSDTGQAAPTRGSDGKWTLERNAGVNATDEYQVALSLGGDDYRYSAGAAMITMTVKAEQID